MARINEKTSGLINSLNYKSAKIKILYWSCFVFMLIVTVICVFPPVWVILSSVKDINEFFQIPPTIFPKSFHPEKLVEAWNMLKFGRYYLNTCQVLLGTLIFSIAVNGMAGYVISRLKPRGSKYLYTLMMWTLMLPTSVSMVTVFKNIVKVPLLNINLTNTYWPLYLMAGANAFYVLIFKGFFDGIPNSLIEAARIDGCNDFSIFYRIVMPLSKPVMMTIMILQLNATWGDFFWPYLILRDSKTFTIMVKIYSMTGTTGFPADLQMASLAFAILPPAILFMFFQKFIVRGVTMSGIKG